jgi:hypothetical protein
MEMGYENVVLSTHFRKEDSVIIGILTAINSNTTLMVNALRIVFASAILRRVLHETERIKIITYNVLCL